MKQCIQPNHIPKSVLRSFSAFLPDKEPTLQGNTIIPVCAPDISGNEEKYATRAIRSSWISSTGDFVEKFENQFQKNISNTKFAVAVNSGTSALHTACAVCGITHGDEVILPAFTMIATANPVIYCGATPVLVDAQADTWNIDTKKIEEKITPKTRAIIVVHIYGLPVSLDPILKLAKKYNLWVIEDAAESHGATYLGKRVGGIGDIAGFSLYANKIITTGEGGMVTTNNRELADRSRSLINSAFSKERHFWHSMVGYGYRMTNLQAAVGVAQIERFKEFWRKKQLIAGWYKEGLERIPGIRFQTEPKDRTHSHWMNGILVDKHEFGMDKNKLRKYLAARGIETRSFFVPMHMQPAYYPLFDNQRYPVAETLCRDGFYLPSSTLLTKQDVMNICRKIQETRG